MGQYYLSPPLAAMLEVPPIATTEGAKRERRRDCFGPGLDWWPASRMDRETLPRHPIMSELIVTALGRTTTLQVVEIMSTLRLQQHGTAVKDEILMKVPR